MNQHAVAAHSGEQTDLRGTNDRSGADRYVTGLNIIADVPDVLSASHGMTDSDLGQSAVGPPLGHHGVGECRQGSAGLHPDRLPWLEPCWRPRTRLQLPHHRQDNDHLVARRLRFLIGDGARFGDIHTANGISVDGSLIEPGQRLVGNNLFGTQQTL